jgi:hypothetical protein
MPSQEHQALTASLSSKSEPFAAARAFTEPTKQAYFGERDIESQLETAWNSLIEIAADTSHDSQDPLVEIVKAVQQEKLRAENDNKPCKIWGEDVKVWEEMPLLGPSLRGGWNRGVYSFLSPTQVLPGRNLTNK